MKLNKISKNFDIYLSNDNIHKKFIDINGKTYHRFMTYLYINDDVYNLSTDYIKELNNIRDKYSELLIDYEYNQKVYSTIVGKVSNHINNDNINILDFGCGEGLACYSIRNNFPNSNIIGYDIRNIPNTDYNELHKIDLESTFLHGENYFSIIFSFFVFQFNITDKQLSEFRRVLKPNGILAFNLIKSSDFSIINKLKSVGFKPLNNFDIKTKNNTSEGYVFFIKS